GGSAKARPDALDARRLRALAIAGPRFAPAMLPACSVVAPAGMAKIANALGVDHLIYGTLQASGNSFVVRLKRLDATSRAVVEWTATLTEPEIARAAEIAFDSLLQ